MAWTRSGEPRLLDPWPRRTVVPREPRDEFGQRFQVLAENRPHVLLGCAGTESLATGAPHRLSRSSSSPRSAVSSSPVKVGHVGHGSILDERRSAKPIGSPMAGA